VGRRRGYKLPRDSIGEHLTNRRGLTKKRIVTEFSRVLLKLLCRTFHRRLASRNLTPVTFARADAYRIHGIGWLSIGLWQFQRMDEMGAGTHAAPWQNCAAIWSADCAKTPILLA
jgi:hypothetical protein